MGLHISRDVNWEVSAIGRYLVLCSIILLHLVSYRRKMLLVEINHSTRLSLSIARSKSTLIVHILGHSCDFLFPFYDMLFC